MNTVFFTAGNEKKEATVIANLIKSDPRQADGYSKEVLAAWYFMKANDLKETLETRIVETESKIKMLEDSLNQLQTVKSELERKLDNIMSKRLEVELEKVVIKPKTPGMAKILAVNNSYEFVVINLGQQHGMEVGKIMGVYRQEELIAKVKVEMIHVSKQFPLYFPPLFIPDCKTLAKFSKLNDIKLILPNPSAVFLNRDFRSLSVSFTESLLASIMTEEALKFSGTSFLSKTNRTNG